MRLGVLLDPASHADPALILQTMESDARRAAEAGFEAVFLPEVHPLKAPAIASPLTALSWLTGRVPDIGVGTAVLAAPLHDPRRLVIDATQLDHLNSRGFTLGLGAGHIASDFTLFGADHRRRGQRLDEVVTQLRRWWSAAGSEPDTLTHGLRPGSLPHPPIWLGASTPAGVRRAARHGLPWLTDPQRDITTLRRLADAYRQGCVEGGAEPRIALFRDLWAAADGAVARDEGEDDLLRLHWYYVRLGAYSAARGEPWVDRVRAREEWTLDQVAPGRLSLGSYGEVAEQLGGWAEELGADHVLVRIRRPGGADTARVHEIMSEVSRRMS